MSRNRAGSLSQPDLEPVILEPPVTTNPLLCRPTLPQGDISTIRRLSGRVNVLPVIARADMLSNDRLAAVKFAVRQDLAAAGIGFGIFDVESRGQLADVPDIITKYGVSPAAGFSGHANGSAGASPPPTSLAPSVLRLPFALISPDVYSHSDGVSRPALSRHELAIQYTPPAQHHGKQDPAGNIVSGRWTRSYRWGSLDCMDIRHCDFLHLRSAIFYHMKVRIPFPHQTA